jgi:carbamoyl-phosphate synthase large subunit
LAELATALVDAGYQFAATRGTAAALRALGHACRLVERLGQGGGPDPDILATVFSGEVRLAVNTPSPEPDVVSDAANIRQATAAEGILCFTTIETAIEAARSLNPVVVAACSDVRPLAEWQGMTCSAGRCAADARP